MNIKQLLYTMVTFAYLVMPTLSWTDDSMVEQLIFDKEGPVATANMHDVLKKEAIKMALVGAGCGAVYYGARHYFGITRKLNEVLGTQRVHTGMLSDLKGRLTNVISTQSKHTASLESIGANQKTLLNRLENHDDITQAELAKIVEQNTSMQNSIKTVCEDMGTLKNVMSSVENRMAGMQKDLGTLATSSVETKVATQKTNEGLKEVLDTINKHREETHAGTYGLAQALKGIYNKYSNIP